MMRISIINNHEAKWGGGKRESDFGRIGGKLSRLGDLPTSRVLQRSIAEIKQKKKHKKAVKGL